jgi:two-component system, OmpR family, phosphate regulon sensor histidine kinase PhoR
MSIATSMQLPPDRRTRQQPWNWLTIAFRAQTYRNILYLFASFPLGTFYFVTLIVGLAAGLGSAIGGIGIPILALCVVAWWWMASFERQLAIWWLRIDIGPMYRPRPQGLTPWRWMRYHLGSSVTWTSLLYLLAKFPLSLLSFMLGLALTALSSFLIFAPVPILIDASLGNPYDAAALVGTCFLTALGLGVGLISLHLLNGLAVVSGRFARMMLGPSDLAEQLRESRQVAVEATKQAERSDQKRRELIVNVSHELRTPIASIRGHVESLQIALDRNETGVQAAPPAELRNYLGIIGREAERLSTLVDELLSLARAESGELKVEVAPVDAAGVVEEVWSSLAPLAKRDRQIILVRDVADGVPKVLADRQRLAQVLLNLTRNAIAYTPAGGIVSISLRADDDTVTLAVADTGMGIPQEEIDRIFERFYRADGSRARSSGGFGLGLAIVRQLLATDGGSIELRSAPGTGLDVVVWLRAVTPDSVS